MKSDQGEKNESQLLEYATRMRRERDEAQAEVTRLKWIISDAGVFLDARRREGIEFSYDSRPLRKLKQEADS